MGDKLLGIYPGDDFPNLAPKAKATKANKQARIHQTEKLLHSKENR